MEARSSACAVATNELEVRREMQAKIDKAYEQGYDKCKETLQQMKALLVASLVASLVKMKRVASLVPKQIDSACSVRNAKFEPPNLEFAHAGGASHM